MRLFSHRAFGIATACFVVAATGASPALAGPDQNKKLVYGTHVDLSPAASVKGNDIQALGVVTGAGSESIPAQATVMWVPMTGNYYLYPTPDTEFLGKQDKGIWQAPQNVDMSQLPIYFGYNTDSSLQSHTDMLKDGNYSLDLLGVSGPGDVEVFTKTVTGVRRVYSSTDTSLRSLIQPRHSHFHTTFSKPGRYVFTYQAIGYKEDGTPIPTMPMKLAWQVGGQNPKNGKILDFAGEYQAAKEKNTASQEASIAFKPDGAFTNITFAGNGNGRLILTNQGHFLDELEVKDGKATTTTYLASESSTYQAIFIPDESDSSSPWLSKEIEYQTGGEAVTVTEEAEELTEPTTSEHFTTAEPVSLADSAITLKAEQTDSSGTKLTLEAKDKNMRGNFVIGLYSSEEQFLQQQKRARGYANCSFEGEFDSEGRYEKEVDLSACKDDKFLRLRITPHPLLNAEPLDELKEIDLMSGKEGKFSLKLSETKEELPIAEEFNGYKPGDENENPYPKEGAQEEEGADPEVEEPEEEELKKDNPPSRPLAPRRELNADTGLIKRSDFDSEIVEFSEGHMDIRLADDSGEPFVALKVDKPSPSVVRPIQKTAIRVGENAKMKRTQKLEDAELDFLGKMGEEFYLLPQVEALQKPWPGFSTESLDYTKPDYAKGVSFKLVKSEVPEGGRAVFFTGDIGGAPTRYFDTDDSEHQEMKTTKHTHLHGSWSFTKPGTYKLYLQAIGMGKDGKEKVLTEAQPLTFLVGKDAKISTPAKPSSKAASREDAPV
ncbi:choice-of-anchor M domain-containing protein [Corynebacterium pseudotuberculosis]|uniref:choice-of-anchor M domain-containing protein n=1 Tax=Corynebacterium pseudotuberculosis TaxID=1719 RepID=UPI0001DD488E|nr:choice-of-anchor M domain-containing protein [Corynebacterium pseudotuberculosis]ADK29849.1 hypothetical protein CPFRC_10380 [Corynebacterium pseudotuberculosis FRC41]ADL21911.1 hypothetical protein CP1002_10360 [Corynebacterium pseudotuberculosis 1002]AIG06292.1 hypothetical protein CPTA_00463 [Corynebacterium pseudotuberculosis]AIG09123.1 hypothetical protein CPTB_01067 [Corynebacterium pseudotuberculosis]AIG11023.1 hypothetical protein CPTC_00735 [Corynebacterium pseudotuberculosis]